MADSKHTPGPWKYDTASGEVVMDDGEVEALVATVNFENAAVEQTIADGHLIAAAPDLVLSGKHLFVKLAEVYQATGQKISDCQALRDWLAAIAKAEGRS